MPEITGVLAIILAIIGLRRARHPGTGGKGLAAAGLTLGILSVVAWSIGLAVAGFAWSNSEPARIAAREYLSDFSRHDITAILNASTHGVKQSQVEQLDDRLRTLGRLQDVTFVGIYFNYANGTFQCRLNGVARYSNGEARFVMTLARIDDLWKVKEFWINGHPIDAPRLPRNVQV